MLKVLIATGGTGGHLFPARQLAELLGDAEVLFAGHQLAQSPFFDRRAPFCEIVSAPSKKQVHLLLKGVWQSIQLIRRFRPDVVVGFGSFHSFPVLLAAAVLRKKIILFEANCSLGKVNRFFVPLAQKLALQFPVKHPKAVYVPLLPWTCKSIRTTEYLRHPDKTTILVFGGSQGAAFINRTFLEAAKLLTFPFQVIHLTGKENLEVRYEQDAIVKPFEQDMASAYEAADLVVCRCGAGTTAELIQFQKPAVVIPYPYAAGDHQRKNGEFLQGGARLLLQKEATPKRLAEEIEQLRSHLDTYKQALRQIQLPKTECFGSVVRAIGGRR